MSRGSGQRQKLEQAVAAIEARHGVGALRQAKEIVHPVPHISTGFAALDGLTGCGGIPLGAMTLLSGVYTSGKVTIAYKALAAAQQAYPKQVVVLLDLHSSADADYLQRAGVDLERLLLVRPAIDRQAIDVLVDLASKRKVRMIVVNSLADLQKERAIQRHLAATLGRLHQTLRDTHTALIWIDDPSAPWIRWFNLDESKAVRQFAALHIEVQLEHLLLSKSGAMRGYASRAKLHKSRWTKAGRSVPLNIEFNGTIKARATW